MPGRLRVLSGAEVVAILGTFGFSSVNQRGSHVKLRRIAPSGESQTLVVPLHREMDPGTLRAVMRQAARFVPEESLRPHFRTE